MKYKDKHGTEIRTGHTVLASHQDTQEPSGFSKVVSDVQLCFYSKNEKRYVPFKDEYTK